MNRMHRREFAGLALGGLGLLSLPSLGRAQSPESDEDHFFLHILGDGGMDTSYLFDARPLAMTQAKLIQNYTNTEPSIWAGANGQTTLASSLVEPLRPFQDTFSVINGVVMAAAFDGHGQNMNFLFTGSPFGGESFVPHLNKTRPIDYLQSGSVFLSLTNGNSGVPLTSEAAKSLVARLRQAPPMGGESALAQHLAKRFAANAQGNGRFSSGSKSLAKAFGESTDLSNRLQTMNVPSAEGSEALKTMGLVGEAFKAGITRSAVLVLSTNPGLDTHAADRAKQQPKMYAEIVSNISEILTYLKQTPYKGGKSLLDVTTVMVSSEFGRTMRQKDRAIDDTGTDHNPLHNSMLLAGKGIRGGLVIGQTDKQTVDETVSDAHKTLDPDDLKIMGRPFDFAGNVARTDKPKVYQAGDYLGVGSVINTLYTLFGVAENRFRLVERNGPLAPTLKALIKS